MSITRRTRLIAAVLAAALVAPAAPAVADPPPWAPAHGYRAKHGKGHYDLLEDIGIPFGRCNRDVVGGLIGAAAGGYAGSHIGEGDGKVAATIGGVVIGAIIGGLIGERMDRQDYACVGQVLEHAEAGKTVHWSQAGTSYAITPARAYRTDGGVYCRPFTVAAAEGGVRRTTREVACRDGEGRWHRVE